MFTIKVLKFLSGWLAYLFEQSEYYETGKTNYEAIGKLIVHLIDNKIVDNFEIGYLDDSEKRPDIEIIRRLNGEI